jgi:hypothetical protein
MRDHSDSMNDTADIITPETDIKIFIEHFKSDNPTV